MAEGSGRDKKGSSGRSYRSKAGLTRQPENAGTQAVFQRWLMRQLNDRLWLKPSKKAIARAAVKLEQMDANINFKTAYACGGLGCAPGGWLQVIARNAVWRLARAILSG